MTGTTITIVWLSSGLLTGVLALLAAIRVGRGFSNRSMRFLMGALLGSCYFSFFVVYLSVSALAIVRPDGTASLGSQLLTQGYFVASIAMDAFALEMLGIFDRPTKSDGATP